MRLMLCGVWAAAFLFSVSTYTLLNDHFDRISRGRQIAQYGEMPFRDFLDPGYFMTEFSSAGMQLLLGDNLLGEMLLDCAFIAGGVTLVALLSLRFSQSVVAALAAALISLLTFPRPYDFDKVFFYPLGLLLCWRLVEAPTRKRMWALACGLVVAALFRYDTALYLAAATIVAMATLQGSNWRAWAPALSRCAIPVVCLSLPVLLFLQSTGGLLNTVDQVVDYARREGAGTQISVPPRLSLTAPISLAALPSPSQTVIVRWASSAAEDDIARIAVESRHHLIEGARRGDRADRTWSYRMNDASPPRLRELLQDAAVEDTSGIERDRSRLTLEPWWIRAQRAVPVLRLRLLAGSWNADNANAFLYYLLHLLPLAAIGVLLFNASSPNPMSRVAMARLSSLISLCTALNVFILRNPVGARIGGIAGPATILTLWLIHQTCSIQPGMWRRIARAGAVVALLLTVWSVAASADWQSRLTLAVVSPPHVASSVGALASSPPNPEIIGGGEFTNLVGYVRECTRPDDRILLTWFAPEVYFFAQRGFAAGLATLTGGHWSDARFQERSIELLTAHPAALVIHRGDDRDFANGYPRLSEYLHAHYHEIARTDFSGRSSPDGSYLVVAHNDRVSTATHGPTSLPCFR